MRLLYVPQQKIDAYLVKALREAGHVVEAAAEPADGLIMVEDGDYQAILLDWLSPGSPWVGRFAAAALDAVIIVIAAQGNETERTSALRAGADACILKPLEFIELEARLEAFARLVKRQQPSLDHGAPPMVLTARGLRFGERIIALSGRESQLMECLIIHAGEVISVERLQRQVWGEDSEIGPDGVRTCVSRLRRKLAQAGAAEQLVSVPGHGYSFQPKGS